MTFVWIAVFIVSLLVMLKGGDWFLNSSEKVGLAFGLTPFVVGVTIVAAGTSLPELISSLFALSKGATDIVVANALGSNVANILLIVGAATLIGRRLVIDKDLINLDIPLLATTTSLFIAIIWDGNVSLIEGIILLIGYGIYFLYTLFYKEDSKIEAEELPLREGEEEHKAIEKLNGEKKRPKIGGKTIMFLLIGALALVFGAQYLIESVVRLSEIWSIAPGVIAISAVAFGTSLPELLVSGMAARKGNAEVALGNIFGSNVFNMLVVVGVPALIKNLSIDERTMTIGLPFLIISTTLFIFSGISRKLHIWEGCFFLLIYALFIGKLFGFL